MADNLQFDAFSNQQIPFSAEAEQSVLGCVLIAPNSMDVVNAILLPEHFYMPQHYFHNPQPYTMNCLNCDK